MKRFGDYRTRHWSLLRISIAASPQVMAPGKPVRRFSPQFCGKANSTGRCCYGYICVGEALKWVCCISRLHQSLHLKRKGSMLHYHFTSLGGTLNPCHKSFVYSFVGTVLCRKLRMLTNISIILMVWKEFYLEPVILQSRQCCWLFLCFADDPYTSQEENISCTWYVSNGRSSCYINFFSNPPPKNYTVTNSGKSF